MIAKSNPTVLVWRGSYLLSLLQSTDGAVKGDDVWCQFLSALQNKWVSGTTSNEIGMMFAMFAHERAAQSLFQGLP